MLRFDRKAGKRVVNDSFITARVNEQKTKRAIEPSRKKKKY